MNRTQPVLDGASGSGRRFLFPLPAYTLGNLAPAAGGPGAVPAAVMPRCPEYGPYVALFTDLDLAIRALGHLPGPGKVILELPTLPAVLDLLEAHEEGFGATHVGIDVSHHRTGIFGLFGPVRSLIDSIRSRLSSAPAVTRPGPEARRAMR